GHAFHITSDEVLTWNQIYEGIAEALEVEATIVHIPSDFVARLAPDLGGSLLGDKTWSVVFDNSKIKAFVPGFQATIPLREGIRRTLARFDADAQRQRVDAGVNTASASPTRTATRSTSPLMRTTRSIRWTPTRSPRLSTSGRRGRSTQHQRALLGG